MFRSQGWTAGKLLGAGFVAACLSSGLAWSQAELPPQGQGSVYAAFGNFGLRDQLFSQGPKMNDGTTRMRAYVVGADYGLSDWFALSGSLTYVQTKYHGPIPHGDYDDGVYHGTWQDASVTALFQAVKPPFRVVPFVGVIVPMTSYETRGLAAAGRGLNQAIAGVGLGWVPRSIPFEIDFTYAYRFVESLQGIDTDRQNMALRFVYRFSRHLTGSLYGLHRRSQGGFDLITDHDEPNFLEVHDAAIALTETSAGIALTWSIDSQWNVYALYSATLSGENLQEANQLGVGVSWKFGGNPVLGGGGRHGGHP